MHRRPVRCAVRVSTLQLGPHHAWNVRQVDTMMTWTHPLRALAALLGTTLQQDLRPAISVPQVSMTLTQIRLLHAYVVQQANTLQRGRHLALIVQLGM